MVASLVGAIPVTPRNHWGLTKDAKVAMTKDAKGGWRPW